MFHCPDVCLDHIVHVDEIAFLSSVTKDARLFPGEHRLGKYADDAGFPPGVLPGTVHVAVAEDGVIQVIGAGVELNVLLPQVLRQSVWGEGDDSGVLGTGVLDRVAIQRPARG